VVEMGEHFSGSVDSALRGTILNVGESIHCLYMASIGNREILTESGFHSKCHYCYVLHTAWCESTCRVTCSIRKTFRFIYPSEK